MKKVFIATIIIFFIFLSIIFAEAKKLNFESSSEVTKDNNESRDTLARKFDMLAQDFIKYANEAAKKGKVAYSTAFKNCADAEKEIAEGFRTGKQDMIDSGRKAYKKAKATLDVLNKENKSKSSKIMPQYKKIIKKYQDESKDYMSDANKAKEDGKEELSNIYKKCSAAKNKIAEGMIKILKSEQAIAKLGTQDIECTKYVNLKHSSKAIRLKTKVINLESCIKECHIMADKAIIEKNYELAGKYKDFASANIIQIEGLKEVASAKKDYKYARKELEIFNNNNFKSKKHNVVSNKTIAAER